ncbi:efflux RND transporter periplasmic adaptor subunit [Phenylobacterium sp.]|uniref:efflux RND transporter periplasmic adaptor subunit n=1 Tax=Phenylobacterium sp. TaxID=1871053 RepID=UPI002E36A29B|nr:efflux RND transporter periplasmic adaptor subunit [Phenylobacterium sp.]HEX4711588.1 efflux RND transporter periplasmic adaptor subunit [Phenylobacterium sp.]
MIKVTSLPAVALLVALSACAAKPAKKPARVPEVGYVTVIAQTVPLEIELHGRTAAYETSDVRPQVSGLIQARNFVEGSIVHKDQTLYQIDPSLYRAAVAQAEANLANAEATRVDTAAKAARYKPLADIEAVAKQDYADAQAAANVAVAQVALAKAALDTARINLRFTRVQAPITGRIGRSLATTGALVTTGQVNALSSIQRLDPIFVDIPQSSADLVALRRELSSGGATPSSAAVRLTLEDGSPYGPSGKIEFAEPVVDPNTGTVTLRATFPNPTGLLLPGMYVRAHLSQATAQNAILAPQQGVSRDPRGNATVYLVGPGNKAVLRTIQANLTVGDKWLVTSGLASGDKVIVEGLNNLKPNQPVRPVPAGSPPQPPPGAKHSGAARPGR